MSSARSNSTPGWRAARQIFIAEAIALSPYPRGGPPFETARPPRRGGPPQGEVIWLKQKERLMLRRPPRFRGGRLEAWAASNSSDAVLFATPPAPGAPAGG